MIRHSIFLKEFYFFPYGHIPLKEIDDFERQKGQKIEKYFWEEKEKLHKKEKNALQNTPRLCFYHQILMQHPKIVHITREDDFKPLEEPLIKKSTKDIILLGEWMK